MQAVGTLALARIACSVSSIARSKVILPRIHASDNASASGERNPSNPSKAKLWREASWICLLACISSALIVPVISREFFIASIVLKTGFSWKLADAKHGILFAEMDAPNTDPQPLPPDAEPTGSTNAQPPPKNDSRVELSPEIRAFLHRMAENLRTHDPDVPKGRYRPS